MEEAMKTRKIPQIDSVEELARYWDTHDLTEFEDHLEEVSEPVFARKRDAFVRIPLSRREVEAVQQLAKARGVAHVALLQEWVREKLRESARSLRWHRTGRQPARH
jgi:hypothetical protein